MRKKITICLSVALFFAIAALHTQSLYAPDQILIRFDKTADPEFIQGLKADLGAVETEYSLLSQTYLWNITDTFPIITESGQVLGNIIEILEFTQGKAKVDAVDLNYQTKTSPLSNSNPVPPFLLENYTPILGCGAYPGNLFQNHPNLTSLKIAIIDTGIDAQSHPDLFGGRIASSFNFITHTDDASDNNGHGTQVSGIIAGMAYVEELPNVKLFNLKALDHNGTGNLFDIIQAIDYAILNGANIINCSFGYEPAPADQFSNLFHALMQEVSNRNILTIVSAGNKSLNIDQTRYFPAGFSDVPNLISVAASKCDGSVAAFTNFGKLSVELAAPGVGIVCPSLNGEWVAKSGTSFATPIVTGIAMQLACLNPQFNAPYIYGRIMNQTVFSIEFEGLVTTNGLANITVASGPNSAWLKNQTNGTEPAPDQISVFPNPFESAFTIQWTNEGAPKQMLISLKDLMNRPVWQSSLEVGKGSNLIPVSPDGNLPSGYYIVELSDREQAFRQKVLKIGGW